MQFHKQRKRIETMNQDNTNNDTTGSTSGAKQRDAKRSPNRSTDAEGKPIVRMPLANSDDFATLDAADFDRLVEQGIGLNWFGNKSRGDRMYARVHTERHDGTRNVETVQRLIMQAGRLDTVLVRNGNTLDLRRRNLKMVTRREQVSEYMKREAEHQQR